MFLVFIYFCLYTMIKVHYKSAGLINHVRK